MADIEHKLEFEARPWGEDTTYEPMTQIEGNCSCGANFALIVRYETVLDVGWAKFKLWHPKAHFRGGCAFNNFPPCHATIALTRHLEKECV